MKPIRLNGVEFIRFIRTLFNDALSNSYQTIQYIAKNDCVIGSDEVPNVAENRRGLV